MKATAIHAFIVGAILVASSSDASAQGRGRGGYRGGGNVYHGSSWNEPHSSYYGNNYWASPRAYGYSPWYGGVYRSYYSTPGYYYSQPSYSYIVPAGDSPNVITQAAYSESNSSNQALLTVFVPNADAQLWLQGIETTSRGTERTFYSPTLELNTNYIFTVKVRWMVNGNAMEQMRDVSIKAGQRSSVDFRVPASEAAPSPMPVPEKRPNQ